MQNTSESSAEYEYKAVKVPDAFGQLQPFLDKHSNGGWRLVQAFMSMGYTVGLIFERRRARSPSSEHQP
jgi:hypothetical protein